MIYVKIKVVFVKDINEYRGRHFSYTTYMHAVIVSSTENPFTSGAYFLSLRLKRTVYWLKDTWNLLL